MALDLYLFQFIYSLAHQWWLIDIIGVFFAKYLGYFLILIAIFLILREKKFQQKVYAFSLIALSVILSRGIIAEALKFFIVRQRPFSVLEITPLIKYDAYDKFMSFPSGHAAFFFALALAVFFLNKKLGQQFMIAALLISLARIFVGIHWPSDILVGALIGLISALIVKKILPLNKKAPVFVDENQQAPV